MRATYVAAALGVGSLTRPQSCQEGNTQGQGRLSSMVEIPQKDPLISVQTMTTHVHA